MKNDVEFICVLHTQDIQGRNDPVCMTCWERAEELGVAGHFSRRIAAYVSRDDCMDENLIDAEVAYD